MKTRTGQTVGIDLGTAKSALAHLDYDGKPVLVRNSDGGMTLPSVVLLGQSGHVKVGLSRDRILLESHEDVVEAVKPQMGNKNWHKMYMGKKLTPEFISALILKKLKQDSEQVIGPIANAVITVPYEFDNLSRKATHDAGRIAGFSEIDVVSEPGAAALALAWMRAGPMQAGLVTEPRIVVVCDIGARAFCQSVVRVIKEGVQVLAADWDTSLADIQWTNGINDFARQRVESFLQRAKEFGQPDDVLVVGGCARNPEVSADLAEAWGRTAVTNIDPGHVVAQGAAVFAAVLDIQSAHPHRRFTTSQLWRPPLVAGEDSADAVSSRFAGDVIRRLRAITAVE